MDARLLGQRPGDLSCVEEKSNRTNGESTSVEQLHIGATTRGVDVIAIIIESIYDDL